MKTSLTSITAIFSISCMGLLSLQVNAKNTMSPTLERALIKICKSAASNIPVKMKNAIDDYKLTKKQVALNVMCNGDDIIAFAQKHGADKTAGKLQHGLGRVAIHDVAMNRSNKLNVTFAE